MQDFLGRPKKVSFFLTKNVAQIIQASLVFQMQRNGLKVLEHPVRANWIDWRPLQGSNEGLKLEMFALLISQATLIVIERLS